MNSSISPKRVLSNSELEAMQERRKKIHELAPLAIQEQCDEAARVKSEIMTDDSPDKELRLKQVDMFLRSELIKIDQMVNPNYGHPAIDEIPGNSRTYEHDIVHPAIGEWLTLHGYVYQHEVKIPDVGQVDFVATREDGHQLIIDGKVDCQHIHRSITQVSDYRVHVNPDAIAALGIPAYTITDKAIVYCENRNVELIPLDVIEKTETVKGHSAVPPKASQVFDNWFWENCITLDGHIDFSDFTKTDFEEFEKNRAFFNYLNMRHR